MKSNLPIKIMGDLIMYFQQATELIQMLQKDYA
jgi:hypothetical protein